LQNVALLSEDDETNLGQMLDYAMSSQFQPQMENLNNSSGINTVKIIIETQVLLFFDPLSAPLVLLESLLLFFDLFFFILKKNFFILSNAKQIRK